MSTKKRNRGKKRKKSIFRLPKWAFWVGGFGIVAIYVFVFYYFFVTPNSFKWKGIFGEEHIHSEYSIRGIDISHYQGEINWDKLRNATIEGCPIRFIIIKATEGNSLLDENFNENFYKSKDNNFIRGVYHFYSPSVSPELQAHYFLKQVHLEEGDLPPVLDIESKGNLTPQQIKKAVTKWMTIVEKAYNVKPILYTNYDFKKKYLNDKIFDKYPYWIAHYYVDTLRYQGKWRLWQHTDFGKVEGIKGHVDYDIYNGSMYDLQKFCIGPREEEE